MLAFKYFLKTIWAIVLVLLMLFLGYLLFGHWWIVPAICLFIILGKIRTKAKR